MIKEVLIHVGTPKTGSTYLQKVVFPNIPNSFYWTESKDLYNLIWNLPFSRMEDYNWKEEKRKLQEIFSTIKQEKLIISHESLFGHPFFNFANHKENTKIIYSLFPQAKILIVIRNQIDFLESLYKHSVQIGYTQKLNRFLNFKKESSLFSSYNYRVGLNIDVRRLKYSFLIKDYEDFFGLENVTLLSYNTLKNDKKEFLNSISKRWGIEIKMKTTNKRSYPSYNYYTLKIALILNKFFYFQHTNGRGLFKESPFQAFLFNHYKKSKILGGFLILSSKLKLYNLLIRFNHLLPTKKQIISAEKRDLLRNFFIEDNNIIYEKYKIDITKEK